MSIGYGDLKKGLPIELDGEPYVVVEYNLHRMQQRAPVMRIRFRSLRTGRVVDRSFQGYDVQLTKADVLALIAYGHKKGRKIWIPQSVLQLMGGAGYYERGKVSHKQSQALRHRIASLLKGLEEDAVLVRRPEPQSSRMVGSIAYEFRDAV